MSIYNKLKNENLFTRLLKANHAAVAVEHALILPVFFGFLFMIIETAILFINTSVLEAGVEAGKRMVMTGQIKQYNESISAQEFANGALTQEDAFRKEFCAQTMAFLNCKDVKFDIRSFSNFYTVNMADPVVDNMLNTSNFSINFGNQCDIVVIRAYYEIISTAGIIRGDVENLGGLKNIISVSSAFKNEPYKEC